MSDTGRPARRISQNGLIPADSFSTLPGTLPRDIVGFTNRVLARHDDAEYICRGEEIIEYLNNCLCLVCRWHDYMFGGGPNGGPNAFIPLRPLCYPNNPSMTFSNINFIKKLIKLGASPNTKIAKRNNCYLVSIVAIEGDVKILAALLKGGGNSNESWFSVLNSFTNGGINNLKMVRMVLRYGGDVNHPEVDAWMSRIESAVKKKGAIRKDTRTIVRLIRKIRRRQERKNTRR